MSNNEQEFQKKLADLMQQLNAMKGNDSADKAQTIASEHKNRQSELRETVKNLQESLDFLRLSVKYLLFDLEATKRENAELRKLLDEQSGGNGGKGKDKA